jgi:hypothetical protein
MTWENFVAMTIRGELGSVDSATNYAPNATKFKADIYEALMRWVTDSCKDRTTCDPDRFAKEFLGGVSAWFGAPSSLSNFKGWERFKNDASAALVANSPTAGFASGHPKTWGNIRNQEFKDFLAAGLSSTNLKPALTKYRDVAAIYDPGANSLWRDSSGYTYLVVDYL